MKKKYLEKKKLKIKKKKKKGGETWRSELVRPDVAEKRN